MLAVAGEALLIGFGGPAVCRDPSNTDLVPFCTTGLGATAHQYDDFAPALTPRYRVVGVTRRGHRGSSAAPGGYGFARLAEDILRVIDAVGIKNPVVIGHSFAGEEMHVLGARHSAKIRGLVYVDAAFDRGDDADNEIYGAALRAYLEKYNSAGSEGYLPTRSHTVDHQQASRSPPADRGIRVVASGKTLTREPFSTDTRAVRRATSPAHATRQDRPAACFQVSKQMRCVVRGNGGPTLTVWSIRTPSTWWRERTRADH